MVKYEKLRNPDTRISDEDKRLEIVSEIYKYANLDPEFCSDFFENVQCFLLDNGYITGKQYNVLVDIYYENKINDYIEDSNEF